MKRQNKMMISSEQTQAEHLSKKRRTLKETNGQQAVQAASAHYSTQPMAQHNHLQQQQQAAADYDNQLWLSADALYNAAAPLPEFKYALTQNMAALEQASYGLGYESGSSCLTSPQSTVSYNYQAPIYSPNSTALDESLLNLNNYETQPIAIGQDFNISQSESQKWIYENCDDASSLTSSSGYNSDDYYYSNYMTPAMENAQQQQHNIANDPASLYYNSGCVGASSPTTADLYSNVFEAELNPALYAACDDSYAANAFALADNLMGQPQQQQQYHDLSGYTTTSAAAQATTGCISPDYFYSNSTLGNGSEWNTIQMDSTATNTASYSQQLDMTQQQQLTHMMPLTAAGGGF